MVLEEQKKNNIKKKTLPHENRRKALGKLFGDSLMKKLELFLKRSKMVRVQAASLIRKENREIRRVFEKATVGSST